MRSPRGFLAVAATPAGAGPGRLRRRQTTARRDSPPSSSSPDAARRATAATSDASEPTTDATTDAPAGLPAACDVLTPRTWRRRTAWSSARPSPAAVRTTSRTCRGRATTATAEAEDLVEVQLALSGPDDYTPARSPARSRRAIASTVEPVEPGSGDRPGGRSTTSGALEASLRVCTAGYNFDIDLEYEDGVDFQGDPEQQTIALAGVVLAGIGWSRRPSPRSGRRSSARSVGDRRCARPLPAGEHEAEDDERDLDDLGGDLAGRADRVPAGAEGQRRRREHEDQRRRAHAERGHRRPCPRLQRRLAELVAEHREEREPRYVGGPAERRVVGEQARRRRAPPARSTGRARGRRAPGAPARRRGSSEPPTPYRPISTSTQPSGSGSGSKVPGSASVGPSASSTSPRAIACSGFIGRLP